MALVERTYPISLNEVMIGQILEIDYKHASVPGGSKILVVGQTTDKLHAIKLDKNVDIGKLNFSLRNLLGDRVWYNPYGIPDGTKITEYIRSSEYVGDKPYRTYIKNLIGQQSLLVLGQQVNWVNTRRLEVQSSVLYGMAHGSYVYVNNHDLNQLALDIINRGYKTYFEGPGEHEDPTQYLLDHLIGSEKYKSKSESWEPTLGAEASILELFGGGGDTLVEGVLSVMEERNISFGQRLVAIVSQTSGPNTIKSSWGQHVVLEDDIKKMVSSVATVGVDLSVLDTVVNNATELREYLAPFVDTIQKYAFGEDWRRSRKAQSSDETDWSGENVPQLAIEDMQKTVNRKRDEHLIMLMRTQPGVYFAGEGHIRLVKDLL